MHCRGLGTHPIPSHPVPQLSWAGLSPGNHLPSPRPVLAPGEDEDASEVQVQVPWILSLADSQMLEATGLFVWCSITCFLDTNPSRLGSHHNNHHHHNH